jgi:hypothetical protein
MLLVHRGFSPREREAPAPFQRVTPSSIGSLLKFNGNFVLICKDQHSVLEAYCVAKSRGCFG